MKLVKLFPEAVGMCPIDWVFSALLAICLPPADVPEEVLRTEIYTQARSPIDGKKLTAAEYALLQEQLREELTNSEAAISDELKHLVHLLRLRQLLKRVSPF